MGFTNKIYNDKKLIVADVNGLLDLESSKSIIGKIIENPEHQNNHKILLDLRNVQFNLSVIDIYRLAMFMGTDKKELLAKNKIAVLVNDDETLNSVGFLETCSCNRGLKMKSFTDFEGASNWLEVELSEIPV